MSVVDENSTYYTMAYDGSSPQPLKVDPLTGRLLVEIIVENVPHVGSATKTDVNNEHSALAVDENEDIKTFLTSDSGYLICDFLLE